MSGPSASSGVVDRHAESEYQKQLSVYYHVIRAVYPDREVSTSLFYTADGERVTFEPLNKEALRDQVREVRSDSG